MYRPLPKYLTIAESKIEGIGLFATEDIPANTELGIGHVQDSRFENGWIRTPLGGFINHSETPNCRIEEKEDFLILVADCEILSGSELTLYYTLYIPLRV
jgi:SET domain-containing protein